MVRMLFLSVVISLFFQGPIQAQPKQESPYARALRQARELEREAERARDKVDAARIDAIGALQQLDSLLQSAYRAELRNLDYLQTLNDKVIEAEKVKVAAIKKGDRPAVARAARDIYYKLTAVVLVMEKIKEKTNLVTVQRELTKLSTSTAETFLKTAQTAARLTQLEELNSKNTPEEILAFFDKDALDVQLKAIEKEHSITRKRLVEINATLKPTIERALKDRVTTLDQIRDLVSESTFDLLKRATDNSLKPIAEHDPTLQAQAMEKAVYLLDATTYFANIITDEKTQSAFVKLSNNFGGAFFMLMKAHITRTLAQK